MKKSDYYAVAANQWIWTVEDHIKTADELANAGVTMVRMRMLRWIDVQPTRGGGFNWGDWEVIYNVYVDRGMKIVVVFSDTPAWATNGKEHTGAAKLRPWRKFVRAAVRKFPQVYAWETWNEPDIKQFYTGTADQFIKMHKVAYNQIKKYSNAKVWGPSVLVVNIFKKGKGRKIVQGVLDSGKLDMYTYHDYSPVNNKAKNAVDISAVVRGRYPISVTEISSHWDAAYFNDNSEEDVAIDVYVIYETLRMLGIKHTMWWPAKDWIGFNGGLIDTNYEGKKQLNVYLIP